MSIDNKTKEQIQQAIASRKINGLFRVDLSKILEADKEEALEQQVSYFAEGKANLGIKELNGIGGVYYTAHTTYRRFLELVQNPDLYFFERGRNLRLL